MALPPAPFETSPIRPNPWERICPECRSQDIRGRGRLVATSKGEIRVEHRCEACGITFWLCPERRQGPQDRRVWVPTKAAWHSTRPAASSMYHDYPRCPLGQAIAVKDRRLGSGGLELCASCARLFMSTIDAPSAQSGNAPGDSGAPD